MDISEKQLKTFAWGSSIVVAALAIYVWGAGLSWQLYPISSYTLFPLFGLLAFSLMWSHYIVSAVRTYFGKDKGITAQYFEVTSWIVLGAILLHPSLLIWQLWRDGMGLPPGSYINYVGPSLRFAVALGSFSFLIFLAYELRHKFGKRSWWKYVQYANDVAMFAIIIHALRLGSHTQDDWFHYVWLFYAATLAIALAYFSYKKMADKSSKIKEPK